ncbi:MAG: MOSC domain-containing protein [Bacteroidota bacterium]
MPKVKAVHLSPTHTFSKYSVPAITLLKGLGVEGDAHCGKLMKHRSRLKQKPVPPNLRQVHFMHVELFDELKEKGFEVTPGLIGENITTSGLDLLDLPRGTLLFLGDTAIVEITGLRNPCNQLNGLQEGLLSAVLDRDNKGNLIRKSGIMGIVLEGGVVKPGDIIRVELPEKPFFKLERV